MGEQPNVILEIFYGKEAEDPSEWLTNYNYCAQANNWSEDRRLDIVPTYLRGQARNWYEEKKEKLIEWKAIEINKDEEQEEEWEDNSFETKFLKKFTTRTRKNAWKRQLNGLTQKDLDVGEYTSKFMKLVNKIYNGNEKKNMKEY